MLTCLFAMMLAAAAPVAEFRFTPDFDLKKFGTQSTRLTLENDVCRVTAKKPEKFTGIRIPVKIAYQPDLALTFEYRVSVPENVKLAALAVSFFKPGSNRSAATLWFKPETKWTQAKYPFSKIKFEPGAEINAFTIYNRLADQSPAGITSFELRNIKIDRDAAPAK